MALNLSHAYLIVRDIAANGGPVVASGWTTIAEAGGWYVSRRDSDGMRVLAWRANTNAAATRALYMLFGPTSLLDPVAASEPLCWAAGQAWTLTLGGDASAIAVMRRWPWWRINGFVRQTEHDGLSTALAVTAAVVRFFGEGGTLPTIGTAFPWRFDATGAIVGTDAAAAVRVNSITGPAFGASLAGFTLDSVAESEPPRS